MKRTALLTFVSVGLVLGTVTAINGCSSSSSDAAPANVKRAPAKPSGPATSDTSTKTFAVQTLYLGDAPRSGADWKTSSERRGTQRLLLEARRMTAHGYRTLLIG